MTTRRSEILDASIMCLTLAFVSFELFLLVWEQAGLGLSPSASRAFLMGPATVIFILVLRNLAQSRTLKTTMLSTLPIIGIVSLAGVCNLIYEVMTADFSSPATPIGVYISWFAVLPIALLSSGWSFVLVWSSVRLNVGEPGSRIASWLSLFFVAAHAYIWGVVGSNFSAPQLLYLYFISTFPENFAFLRNFFGVLCFLMLVSSFTLNKLRTTKASPPHR